LEEHEAKKDEASPFRQKHFPVKTQSSLFYQVTIYSSAFVEVDFIIHWSLNRQQ